MPVYKKLVRNKILLIIERTGRKYISCTLGNDEYIVELTK